MITRPKRRLVKFNSPDQIPVEIDRLQAARYRKHGNWSLPQACRHLAMVIETNLIPPASDQPTADEKVMKDKFFGMINGPGGMPENLPIGNPELVPSTDSTDAEIEHLKTALQALVNYPHKCIKVGRCGPVPVAEVIALHLAHAAHHLSFLISANDRRDLQFADFDAAIADVQLLRQGYYQTGQWNLPQIARHATIAIVNSARPAVAPPTPEQTQARPMLDKVLAGGKIPSGLQAPDRALPPTDCTDADIDALITALQSAQNYPHASADHFRFGPLSNAEYKKLVLAHTAHHLSHLIPITGN